MAQINDAVKWKKWFPGADSAEFLFIDGKIKGIETGDMKALMITRITDSTVLAENIGPGSKKGETGWNFISSGNPNSITVQWYMDFYLKWYPWEKFASLLLEKSYGPNMEQGLTNLKKLAEN